MSTGGIYEGFLHHEKPDTSRTRASGYGNGQQVQMVVFLPAVKA
jgi:hypothetical protein